MRIVDIRETAVPIASAIRNAYIDFSLMTASVVAVVTDVVRDGRPVVKSPTGEQRHEYSKPGSYTIRVTVRDASWGTEDGLKEDVEVK